MNNRTKPMTTDEIKFFKKSVVEILNKVDIPNFANRNAVNLLLGTAAQESNFMYQTQLGNGPARSYYQIEPASCFDVIDNYIEYRAKLKAEKERLLDGIELTRDNVGSVLIENFSFATFIARCLYYRRSGVVLPTDRLLSVDELAGYWKKYYNTEAGKGTVEEFKKNWQRFKLDSI